MHEVNEKRQRQVRHEQYNSYALEVIKELKLSFPSLTPIS
jgi:hypothetical protein